MGEQGGTLTEEAELAPLLEERSVVERLQAGDRAAAGTLYHWYGDCLFREVILPRLPQREQAEDVLRDTFRLVLERIRSYRPESNKSIYFWIRRIAINRTIDVFRAHRRARKLEDAVKAEPVFEESPDAENLDRDQTRTDIQATLAKINPRYAEALRMRLLEDRSREDCAAHLGVTLGNFDVILHRACLAFRKSYPLESVEDP